VAETVAAVLASLYDFNFGHVTNAREYVQHYAKGENPGRAAMAVLTDVRAVLDIILEPGSVTVAEPIALAA